MCPVSKTPASSSSSSILIVCHGSSQLPGFALVFLFLGCLFQNVRLDGTLTSLVKRGCFCSTPQPHTSASLSCVAGVTCSVDCGLFRSISPTTMAALLVQGFTCCIHCCLPGLAPSRHFDDAERKGALPVCQALPALRHYVSDNGAAVGPLLGDTHIPYQSACFGFWLCFQSHLPAGVQPGRQR